ncbi:hypothetical protein FA039_05815 [Escherichia coli]|nr:hypothetical protein [Escherichia coli]
MPGNSSLAGRYVAFLRCRRPNRLAKCYRDTLPGVALYAWLQAEQRQPNARQHRAVAYQAYQVEDYATALAAGRKSVFTT